MYQLVVESSETMEVRYIFCRNSHGIVRNTYSIATYCDNL